MRLVILVCLLAGIIPAWAESSGGSAQIAPIVPRTLVAWGDSYTAGNEDHSGVTYPNVLAPLFWPHRTVVNNGVGGDTSSQILTRFQAVSALWCDETLIWSGRNNYTDPTTVQSDIAAMIADVLPCTHQYMVLSIMNGEYANEHAGQTNYNDIINLNSALASTYGQNYLDVRSMLVAAYNPANGADVLDRTNDVPPFTLRAVDTSGVLSGALDSSSCSFTLTPAAGTVTAYFILTIDSEYILLTTISGGTTVTACTRGYGGTTAASHNNGASYAGTDPAHLSAAGYTLVAQYIYAKTMTLGGW